MGIRKLSQESEATNKQNYTGVRNSLNKGPFLVSFSGRNPVTNLGGQADPELGNMAVSNMILLYNRSGLVIHHRGYPLTELGILGCSPGFPVALETCLAGEAHEHGKKTVYELKYLIA